MKKARGYSYYDTLVLPSFALIVADAIRLYYIGGDGLTSLAAFWVLCTLMLYLMIEWIAKFNDREVN